MLVGEALQRALNRNLWVSPILDPEEQIGFASIDLRLGTLFSTSERRRQTAIDPHSPSFGKELANRKVFSRWGGRFVLHPRALALAATLEFLKLDNTVSARIEGRSSPGRTGILAVTAGAIHPGFVGSPTLELINAGETPIVLHPGDRIAQLVVMETSEKTSSDDDAWVPSRYQLAIDPEDSRWNRDMKDDRFIRAVMTDEQLQQESRRKLLESVEISESRS